MSEVKLERKLKKRVEGVGGKCLKFTSPGLAGVPDRICLFPGGRVVFVELKAPGGKLRPLQMKRHEELQNLGFKVYTLDQEGQIDGI